MNKESIKFLESLMGTASPSGFEEPVQKVMLKELSGITDETKTDVLGNLAGIKNAGGTPRIMLAGHCDEIGLMIKYITDEGFLYFATIGGMDPVIIPGQRVIVHSEKGDIKGVIGKNPIHLMDAEEMKKQIKIEDLWIDIGTKNKKESEKLVSIGDPVTFDVELINLNNGVMASKAFDDKIGGFIVVETMRQIYKKTFNAAVFGVSTVQEEVGLRGAKISSFDIEPDIGIAIDVGFATDYPGINKRKAGDVKIGAGPILARGANINPKLGRMLIDTAKKHKIPYQMSGEPRGTGTDANVIQLSKSGVAAALISIPLRYVHTPVEMLSISDAENTIKLLVAFITDLPKKINFTP